MSGEEIYEDIDPPEDSTHAATSQSASQKLQHSTVNQHQLNATVSPQKSNHPSKPPVPPKPSPHKACTTKLLPTTATQGSRHQETQSPNNGASLKNEYDSPNELPCGSQRQRSKLAIHSPKGPALPLPHSYVRTSPASPPALPHRPRSTSYPDIRHKSCIITENEKQPPLPPKPKNMAHRSYGEDLKVLPAESERSLTLTELADNHSFPVQVKVLQGFYGETNTKTLYDNETFNIVCLKHEEVLVIRDDSQHHYNVPLSSAIQFSLLYAPDGMTHEEAMRGQIFKKVADIVDLKIPPKVICATKSCSGVKGNEVLVIRGIQKSRMKGKKGLKVFSLLTRSKKTLPHDCAGDFSTESSLIHMYPADIRASLHYLKNSLFPCDAKLYFNSEVTDQLQSLPMAGHLTGVITVCELNTQRSLVAYQVFGEDRDGENPPIFDIPLHRNLSDVEIIVSDRDLKNESGGKHLTSSTVSVLKSVSSNPSKLQPWEPVQSDATKTLLRQTVRRGYENVGIRLEVNPQWTHPATMHELMADNAEHSKHVYEAIPFDNIHSDVQSSDMSETDLDSPSHESNGYDYDRPQLSPKPSTQSRSGSSPQIATRKELQAQEYTYPVQNISPDNVYDDILSPLKVRVPPAAPTQVGIYTSPLTNTSREQDEYTTCTGNQTESDHTFPKPIQDRNETSKSESHPPKQERLVDLPLQLQEQIQSLVQRQLSSLMAGKKSNTEKVQEPVDSAPVPADDKMRNSDLKYIMQTLCDLSAWYLLGVYLDVPKGKLDQFHATYGGGPDAVERCKIETVCYWLENAKNPTWVTLAAAVYTMGRRAIFEKISNRCGGSLPIPEEGEQYEMGLEVSPKQVPEIKPLQKEMEVKDQEFYLVERKQVQLEKQLRNLQTELTNVRDWLQFNERLTRKLISDDQRLKSDLTRATMSCESSHVLNQSLAMHRKRDKVISLRKEQQRSKSKLEVARKERQQLWEKLHNLESKIVSTSQELRQLHSQQQSARVALQKQEQAINESLVSTTEHPYYNIVVLDGKVEMRLTQQQVETLHRKVSNENLKVEHLRQQLQFYQQQLQEVTRQKELLDRKGQVAAELEKHERAYLESTLEADVMQCQIEISTTEFHKQEMENRIHLLRSQMTKLTKRQQRYEQIEHQKKSSSQRGMPTDPSHRPRSSSVSQVSPSYRKPIPEDHYYYEEVDSPSSSRSHVHHFHRNHSAHPAKAIPIIGYRGIPISTNGEQHQPFNSTATPYIPATHAQLFRNRSLRQRRHKPHPQLHYFPSAIPYYSNPPYIAMRKSPKEEYTRLPDDSYVMDTFHEMEADENASNNDYGAMYEPMASYDSHEYSDFLDADGGYLQSSDYDSDSIEEVDECYTETDFTQPSDRDLAHQLPSHPHMNKYM